MSINRNDSYIQVKVITYIDWTQSDYYVLLMAQRQLLFEKNVPQLVSLNCNQAIVGIDWGWYVFIWGSCLSNMPMVGSQASKANKYIWASTEYSDRSYDVLIMRWTES